MSAEIRRFHLRFAVDGWCGPPESLYGPGHAVFLALVARADPAAAAALHDANRRKPFALSPVRIEATGNGPAAAELTVNTWNSEVGALVAEALERALELDIAVRGHPAVLLDFSASPPICLDELSSTTAPPSVTIRFLSPTFFSLGRQDGRQLYGLLPDPAFVVGSWLRPWQDAEGVLPDGVSPQRVLQSVSVRQVSNLSTAVVKSTKTALTGFVGETTYVWVGSEAWGARLLMALARFAEYCGTGAKTGFGFGQTLCIGLPSGGLDGN